MSNTLTPLVISTARGHSPGQQYTWNKLQNPGVFISEIVTQDVNLESDELHRLISGIPTPFARASMFRYALADVPDGSQSLSGLRRFYQVLQDEWKGFVAYLALENQDVTVERIDLVYSDGRDQDATTNLYEPTGALGSMLFEDVELWCDQDALRVQTQRKVPFVQVIKIGGQVVGGTAPECLLFTSAAYRVRSAKGLVDEKSGRFSDPLKANLSADDLTKLWLYIYHLSERLTTYRDQFVGRQPRITALSGFLERWLRAIEDRARERGVRLVRDAIKPTFTRMGAPFDVLFNIENRLFGYRGRIASDRGKLPAGEGSDVIEVELDAMLLDPSTTTLAELVLNDPADEQRLGFHVLRVPVGKDVRIYALPLSERGLAIFQDELDGLLGGAGDVRSRLTGAYDQSQDALRVTFELDVAGTTTMIEKVYSTIQPLQGQRAICWPDFVAKDWRQYYLYSEVPHNGVEWNAMPLRADRETFSLLGKGNGEDFRFERLFEAGQSQVDPASADLVVEYDISKINAAELKYEIYRSEHPFKALQLRHRDRLAGFLVLRNPTSGHANTLRRHLAANPSPVRVGIDFGSNNTCVSFYKKGDREPKLLQFRNRRRFLLGAENPEGPRYAATPGEVFFFQNEPTRSNTIKSMIMIHDERRIRGLSSGNLIQLEREVTGGFPVFEKNIPVEASTETVHTVRFDTQPSYIKYNMKWSQDEKENAYKAGLLKTLWLKTCAELFDVECYPDTLAWAYPSAMNAQTRMQYGKLWSDVVKVNPLHGKEPAKAAEAGAGAALPAFGALGGFTGFGISSSEDKALTEASAVCRHALVQNVTVAADSVFIGFDVGGSTTDILCLASKRGANGSYEETLIKEGSIRLAAGLLADATSRSGRFQDVLRQYCIRTHQVIHGVTVPPDRLNAGTAAFYYNQLIDRLESQAELEDLYKGLAANCPELFSLNAYMTGLIMFYAGQLAALVRQVQAAAPGEYIQPFSKVTIGCFGKGGRMFDWIPSAVGKDTAQLFYQMCFALGYGPSAQAEIRALTFRPSDPQHVKAEVSFGLASTREVSHTTDKISELVGEAGYRYDGQPLAELQGVESRHLLHFGNQLSLPDGFPRFTEFLLAYREFSKSYFGLNMPNIQQDVARMTLIPYVQNLPGYHLARKAAQRGEPFDFEAPFIILQGMCFLEQVLQPHLFGKN